MITTNQIKLLTDYFSKRQEVIAVFLYGSNARNTNNALSDIDIAVMVGNTNQPADKLHLEYIDEMMEIFQTDDVDVQLINSQTPAILAVSMIKGKLLYCKSPGKKVEITSQILSKYQDFEPFLRIHLQNMEKRLQGETYAGR